MAGQLGVGEATVTLWETGRARPLPRQYGKIVRFLGYDPLGDGTTLTGRLELARRRLGLTLAEFATKVGLDEGSLGHWLRGDWKPKPSMEARLRAILERLEGSGEAGSGPASASYHALTRMCRRVPPHAAGIEPRSLGDRLRKRRLDLQLSQAEAGQRLGVSSATVRRWERSQCRPGKRHSPAIERFLAGQS